MVGRYIRDRLAGVGRVFIIEGIRGVENADLRKQGFVEGLTEGSQIEVVASVSANWHTDEAFYQTAELLQQYGAVEAILCANDKMALGALQALELNGLAGKVLIGSYDNIEAVRAEMRSKRIQATVEQHPALMGEYGVALAMRALQGRPLPKVSPVPLDLVTCDTFSISLGISISCKKNPFFGLLIEGALHAADLFGATLHVVDAEDRDDKQLSDILGFIEKQVDAIIVNPTNSETIVPGIELANAKGIPVFCVDRKVSGGEIVSLVASDNYAGGQLAADIMAKWLKGKGMVVELEGIPGASVTKDRGAGFNAELRKYPGIKVVARESAQFSREQAKQIIKQLQRKNVQFDAVFAHNDNMILGVVDELGKDGSLNKILIGFDGIRQALDAVRSGELVATIVQVPKRMGHMVVAEAVSYLRGEERPGKISVALDAVERKQ